MYEEAKLTLSRGGYPLTDYTLVPFHSIARAKIVIMITFSVFVNIFVRNRLLILQTLYPWSMTDSHPEASSNIQNIDNIQFPKLEILERVWW